MPRTAADPSLTEHLVFMATLAPSVHNTQPWRFVRVPDGLLLRADPTRRLPVLDPDGRSLVVSCGAALHHLVVAARAAGQDAHVTLLPDPRDATALAHVAIVPGAPASPREVELAVAVLHRSTVRGPFGSAPVPAGVLDRLALAAEAEGAGLRVVRVDEQVPVAVLVDRADRYLLADPRYRAELEAWYRPAGEPALDGIPVEAVDTGAQRGATAVGRDFHPPTPHPRGEDPPRAERDTVVVLVTRGDSTRERLVAGMALSRVLLEATAAGLVAQPLGQVTDVPATRAALAAELGLSSTPQVVLRLGPGRSQHLAGRRGVDEVLG